MPGATVSVAAAGVLAEDESQRLAGDQHPVQAPGACAAHPALRNRIRPRRPDRRFDDPHASPGQYSVKHSGELGIVGAETGAHKPGPHGLQASFI
jgi:hypothetical protein